jgi:hypothetical protein
MQWPAAACPHLGCCCWPFMGHATHNWRWTIWFLQQTQRYICGLQARQRVVLCRAHLSQMVHNHCSQWWTGGSLKLMHLICLLMHLEMSSYASCQLASVMPVHSGPAPTVFIVCSITAKPVFPPGDLDNLIRQLLHLMSQLMQTLSCFQATQCLQVADNAIQAAVCS